MSLKLFITISLAVLLSACGTHGVVDDIGDTTYLTTWRTYNCGDEPARDAIIFRIAFDDFFFVTDKGDYVLSSGEYAELGEGMQEIKKGSKQLKQVILFYRDCILAAQIKAAEDSDP